MSAFCLPNSDTNWADKLEKVDSGEKVTNNASYHLKMGNMLVISIVSWIFSTPQREKCHSHLSEEIEVQRYGVIFPRSWLLNGEIRTWTWVTWFQSCALSTNYNIASSLLWLKISIRDWTKYSSRWKVEHISIRLKLDWLFFRILSFVSFHYISCELHAECRSLVLTPLLNCSSTFFLGYPIVTSNLPHIVTTYLQLNLLFFPLETDSS